MPEKRQRGKKIVAENLPTLFDDPLVLFHYDIFHYGIVHGISNGALLRFALDIAGQTEAGRKAVLADLLKLLRHANSDEVMTKLLKIANKMEGTPEAVAENLLELYKEINSHEGKIALVRIVSQTPAGREAVSTNLSKLLRHANSDVVRRDLMEIVIQFRGHVGGGLFCDPREKILASLNGGSATGRAIADTMKAAK